MGSGKGQNNSNTGTGSGFIWNGLPRRICPKQRIDSVCSQNREWGVEPARAIRLSQRSRRHEVSTEAHRPPNSKLTFCCSGPSLIATTWSSCWVSCLPLNPFMSSWKLCLAAISESTYATIDQTTRFETCPPSNVLLWLTGCVLSGKSSFPTANTAAALQDCNWNCRRNGVLGIEKICTSRLSCPQLSGGRWPHSQDRRFRNDER